MQYAIHKDDEAANLPSMSSKRNGSHTKPRLRTRMVSAFLGFFVGTLLWRTFSHTVGWSEKTVNESLALATFLGCLWALLLPFLDRRADRAEASAPEDA